MKILIRVNNCLFQGLYNSEQLKVSRFQEETLLFLLYYFTTSQAEALIKQTTASIYKKFTIKT